jgi:hypothetical protein
MDLTALRAAADRLVQLSRIDEQSAPDEHGNVVCRGYDALLVILGQEEPK